MTETNRLLQQPVISTAVNNREWISCALSEHEPSLIRYAQFFVRDVEAARDIVQDACLKLCQQQQPFDSDYLKRWLFKVCRNGAIDYIRKENRVIQSNSAVSEIVGREQGPEQSYQRQETHQAVLNRIATLPQNQQEVLRLKFQSDFSYREIAEVTGLTVSNVGILLHTAIAKLRVQFAAD